jgi:hypothetical protein
MSSVIQSQVDQALRQMKVRCTQCTFVGVLAEIPFIKGKAVCPVCGCRLVKHKPGDDHFTPAVPTKPIKSRTVMALEQAESKVRASASTPESDFDKC